MKPIPTITNRFPWLLVLFPLSLVFAFPQIPVFAAVTAPSTMDLKVAYDPAADQARISWFPAFPDQAARFSLRFYNKDREAVRSEAAEAGSRTLSVQGVSRLGLSELEVVAFGPDGEEIEKSLREKMPVSNAAAQPEGLSGMGNPEVMQLPGSGGLVLDVVQADSSQFPYISVTVRATTNGEPTNILLPGDFSVKEKEGWQTNFFSVTPPGTNAGVRMADLVILIDTSSSMGAEIDGVRDNCRAFADALADSDIDYRLGLVRFGAWADGGAPAMVGNWFTRDKEEFKSWVDELTNETHVGNTEPGFAAIRYAITNYNFRPGTQKVFLLITDEESDDRDKDTTISLMRANNVTVHVAVECGYLTSESDYCDATSVSGVSGGLHFAVLNSYTAILDTIARHVANTYILTYRTSNTNWDGTTRLGMVTAEHDTMRDTVYFAYTVGGAPVIQRTLETIALDGQSLVAGSTQEISVFVTDSTSPFVQNVALFVRSFTSNSFWTSFNMVAQGSNRYAAIIPAELIVDPGTAYYIRATDGQVATTLPSSEPELNAFHLGVLPNVAPVIIHTAPTEWNEGTDLPLQIRVVDSTHSIKRLGLMYRTIGQFMYKWQERTYEAPLPTDTTETFTIPGHQVAPPVLQYYIRAIDDLGIASTWPLGGTDLPYNLNINSRPVANAGEDRVVSAGPDCVAQVELNGSGSSDRDGDPLSFLWKQGETILANSAVHQVQLPLGVATFTLVVTDSHGLPSEDTVTIAVVDTQGPTITCPSDLTIESAGLLGTNVFFTVEVDDECDPAPVLACNPASGSFFPFGTNLVQCVAQDVSGNTSECSFSVNVVVLDTMPPSVEVITPTSQTVYTTDISPITVAGTASDDRAVAEVTWTNNRGGAGVCTGTASWSCMIDLEEGENVIDVTAADRSNNKAHDQIIITFRPAGRISGQVKEFWNDEAIPYATVELRKEIDLSSPPYLSVTADADGQYNFGAVEIGTYLLTASHPVWPNNFETREVTVEQGINQFIDMSLGSEWWPSWSAVEDASDISYRLDASITGDVQEGIAAALRIWEATAYVHFIEDTTAEADVDILFRMTKPGELGVEVPAQCRPVQVIGKEGQGEFNAEVAFRVECDWVHMPWSKELSIYPAKVCTGSTAQTTCKEFRRHVMAIACPQAQVVLDCETMALHEIGHALGLGHVGETPPREGDQFWYPIMKSASFGTEIGDVLYTDWDHSLSWGDVQGLAIRHGKALPKNWFALAAEGPVQLRVIDPLGRVLGADISEIPEARYREGDQNEDGEPDAQAYLPSALDGVYTVALMPRSKALLGATYSLSAYGAGWSRPVAMNAQLSGMSKAFECLFEDGILIYDSCKFFSPLAENGVEVLAETNIPVQFSVLDFTRAVIVEPRDVRLTLLGASGHGGVITNQFSLEEGTLRFISNGVSPHYLADLQLQDPLGSRIGYRAIVSEKGAPIGAVDFSVVIADKTPPEMVCPADMTVECASPQGTELGFEVPATDNFDHNVSVRCIPESESIFPLGSTLVACIAVDSSGNSNRCSFTVTVVDTTPPTLACPTDVLLECTGRSGTPVLYSATASDLCDMSPVVQCDPPSGSLFPAGVTPVNCVATDASGNPATCNFTVTVRVVNHCPEAVLQSVTVPADGSVSITLAARDADEFGCGAYDLTFRIVDPPAHGTLSGSPPHLIYTPEPGYPAVAGHEGGADSFTFIVNDGECDSGAGRVDIQVGEVNEPPADCVAWVWPPDCSLSFTSQSHVHVLALNGADACVILAGASVDPEDDPLQYFWFEDEVPIGFGALSTNRLPVGCHTITLAVSDGASICWTNLEVCVMTAGGVTEECVFLVGSMEITRKNKRPLIASLKAACASFDRGNFISAMNQLEAFQNKVRAQLGRDDPATAQTLIECVQLILEAFQCSALLEQSQLGSR
jgi:hypothetical protein